MELHLSSVANSNRWEAPRGPARPGRRLLAVSATAGGIGAILAFGTLVQRYGSEREAAIDGLQAEAANVAAVIEAELTGRIAVLEALAATPTMTAVDVAAAQQQLDALPRERTGFSGSVALIGGDAQLLARAGGIGADPARRDLSDRDYVEEVLRTEEPFISAALVGRLDQRRLVVVAVPVEGEDGRPVAVLSGSIVVRNGDATLFGLGTEGLRVVDRANHLIDDGAAAADLVTPKNQALIDDARGEQPRVRAGVAGVDGEGGRMVATATIREADWVLLIDRPVGEVLSSARLQLGIGSAITAGALLTLLAGCAVAARRTDRSLALLEAERAAQRQRLDRMHALSTAVSDMGSIEEVREAFRTEILPALGACAGSIHLGAEPDEPRHPPAGPNLHDALVAGWRDVPRTIQAPIAEVMASGDPRYVPDASETGASCPPIDATRAAHGDAAWAALPLLRSRTVIGVVVYAFAEPQPFDEAQRSEIDEITTRIAHAVDRVQLFQAELNARAQAEELHELSAELGSATTTEEVAGAAVRLLSARAGVVGVLLGLLDASATQLELHGNLSASGLRRPLPTNLAISDNVALTRAARDGTSLWFGDQETWRAASPWGAGFFADSSARAVTSLPLRTTGRPMGALAVLFDRPQAFERSQRDHLRAVAAHCSEALQRARLYDDAQNRAITLQRHLLPESLPRCPGLRYAVRYKPASDSLVAGGDWYDVILRSDGSAVVIVGDVVGHGAGAAAIMGQLRAVSHALAVDRQPAEVLTGLDQYATELAPAMLATVAVVGFDAERRTVEYALAGHPPPLLVDVTGAPTWLREATTPPIGVATGARRQCRAPVTSGSTLVCYTDGLVERRDRSIDVGMGQLAALLADGSDDIEDLAARLLRTLAPEAPDDVAVIAVRVTGTVRRPRARAQTAPATSRPG